MSHTFPPMTTPAARTTTDHTSENAMEAATGTVPISPSTMRTKDGAWTTAVPRKDPSCMSIVVRKDPVPLVDSGEAPGGWTG